MSSLRKQVPKHLDCFSHFMHVSEKVFDQLPTEINTLPETWTRYPNGYGLFRPMTSGG